jgi:hypothetical protein
LSPPRIAIATCADYADLKVDDELLREELAARDVESAAVVWDDEGSALDSFDACLIELELIERTCIPASIQRPPAP